MEQVVIIGILGVIPLIISQLLRTRSPIATLIPSRYYTGSARNPNIVPNLLAFRLRSRLIP